MKARSMRSGLGNADNPIGMEKKRIGGFSQGRRGHRRSEIGLASGTEATRERVGDILCGWA
jgi:hypothetical protein